MGDNEKPSSQEQDASGKVLYVPNGFAGLGSPNYGHELFSVYGQDVLEHFLVTFENAGYGVAIGKSPVEKSDEAVGFYADPRVRDSRLFTESIAKTVGVQTPPTTPFDAITSPSSPLVAKYPKSHGGEYAYLIENGDQLNKFKAWMLMQFSPSIRRKVMGGRQALFRVAEEVGQRVSQGELEVTDIDVLHVLGSLYPLQEYVQTPSDYYTSFRVVADAHGFVHYGALLRSSFTKGSQKLVNNVPSDRPEGLWHMLLQHTESPLFLNATRIVSNEAQGGQLILLDGDPVNDPVDAQVLSDHGIDPSRPELSFFMKEKASLIGREARMAYPYVGIDFLLDAQHDKRPNLVEINLAPVITPRELGLQRARFLRTTSASDNLSCDIVMMRRVANKIMPGIMIRQSSSL